MAVFTLPPIPPNIQEPLILQQWLFEVTKKILTLIDTSDKAADSELLDGIDSSSFLRSDESDTFTGTQLTVNGKVIIDSSAVSRGLELHGEFPEFTIKDTNNLKATMLGWIEWRDSGDNASGILGFLSADGDMTWSVIGGDIVLNPDSLVTINKNLTIVGSQVSTIDTLVNDATPSVSGGRVWLTGGTTTITDFDDGVTGQEIIIMSEHAVTITDGTNIFLNGSGNFIMASTDSLHLIQKVDTFWYEIGRSVN